MEQNKEIVFEVMVMYSDVLQNAIDQHNGFNNTDFEIAEIIDDEVIFCKIKATQYKVEDIFSLKHRLSVIEHKLRDEGKIDW